MQYAAYKAAQYNASKCRQVVMLYDGAIRYVQKAIAAIQEKNIQERYNNLEQACTIILGLQSALDFENGGDVAEILDQYYHSLDMRLLTVHRNNRTDICEQVIVELKMMRDAWDEIDQQHGGASLPKEEKLETATQGELFSGFDEKNEPSGNLGSVSVSI
jgi:flagellar protein FliS